jgi:hypothetical protein
MDYLPGTLIASCLFHMPIDPSLVVTGFLVGLLVGLTGMGGGAIMTPFLISAVGVIPIVAVGTDLVYSAATKIVDAWLHARQGPSIFRLVKRLAMGSVPAGLLAVAAIRLLPGAGVDADQAVRRGSSAPMCFTQRFWSARPALPTPMAAVLTGFLPRLSCSDRFRVLASAPG